MAYITTVSDAEAEGAVARAYAAFTKAVGGVFETTRILSTWPWVASTR